MLDPARPFRGSWFHIAFPLRGDLRAVSLNPPPAPDFRTARSDVRTHCFLAPEQHGPHAPIWLHLTSGATRYHSQGGNDGMLSTTITQQIFMQRSISIFCRENTYDYCGCLPVSTAVRRWKLRDDLWSCACRSGGMIIAHCATLRRLSKVLRDPCADKRHVRANGRLQFDQWPP